MMAETLANGHYKFDADFFSWFLLDLPVINHLLNNIFNSYLHYLHLTSVLYTWLLMPTVGAAIVDTIADTKQQLEIKQVE
jgi:hypothetical protein